MYFLKIKFFMQGFDIYNVSSIDSMVMSTFTVLYLTLLAKLK